MTEAVLRELREAIYETSEFKQLVYALGRALADHKPAVGILALQTVMTGIVEKHDAACGGQLTALMQPTEPSHTTKKGAV